VDRDAAGGVAGRGDDPQAEHVVAVSDRGERPGDGDQRDVVGAGVALGVGCALEDVRRAALVVAVMVGQDQVAHRGPRQADLLERRLDLVGAARDAGVDDRRLAAAGEDIGRDEAQVDPLPRGFRTAGRARRIRGAGAPEAAPEAEPDDDGDAPPGLADARAIGLDDATDAGAHAARLTTASANAPLPMSARNVRRSSGCQASIRIHPPDDRESTLQPPIRARARGRFAEQGGSAQVVSRVARR
jgi:hypothetical protein